MALEYSCITEIIRRSNFAECGHFLQVIHVCMWLTLLHLFAGFFFTERSQPRKLQIIPAKKARYTIIATSQSLGIIV